MDGQINYNSIRETVKTEIVQILRIFDYYGKKVIGVDWKATELGLESSGPLPLKTDGLELDQEGDGVPAAGGLQRGCCPAG